MKRHKDAALQRLARLEGQVRGVRRMIEEDRYCIEVLHQTLAIRSALSQIELLILQDHADECVEEAIASSVRTSSAENSGSWWRSSIRFAGRSVHRRRTDQAGC